MFAPRDVAGRTVEEAATLEEAEVPDSDTGELDKIEPPVTVTLSVAVVPGPMLVG